MSLNPHERYTYWLPVRHQPASCTLPCIICLFVTRRVPCLTPECESRSLLVCVPYSSTPFMFVTSLFVKVESRWLHKPRISYEHVQSYAFCPPFCGQITEVGFFLPHFKAQAPDFLQTCSILRILATFLRAKSLKLDVFFFCHILRTVVKT